MAEYRIGKDWSAGMSRRRSLDQIVGSNEQGQRHLKPKRLGGLEVDDQFKLCRLFHGQITGPRALENLGHDKSALSPHAGKNRPIGGEPSGLRMLPPLVNGRESIFRREANDIAM